jgi:hypothetical protein
VLNRIQIRDALSLVRGGDAARISPAKGSKLDTLSRENTISEGIDLEEDIKDLFVGELATDE